MNNDIYVKYRETTRIGNIMFPIACAKQLADERGCDFFLYIKNVNKKINPESNMTIAEYISLFKNNAFKNIKVTSTLPKGCYTYEQKEHSHNFSYVDIVLPEAKPCVLSGSFESAKFFDKVDVNKLFPLDRETKSSILKKYKHILELDNITAINIRRGDFLKFNDAHPVCTANYYFNAIKYLGEDFPYLIISDDLTWCKSVFKGDNFFFVNETDPVENLYTMALCKNIVISNSTYSWWGAYLNKNKDKKVIAPKNWFGQKSQSYIENFLDNDRYCKDWIIMDEDGTVFNPKAFTCDKITGIQDNDVIVSLTSWEKRIKYLPQFFECLCKQTIQPKKYILWLSSDEIDANNEALKELSKYKKLEVHWVDKNLKSFKKFLSIQQYPNAFNIILDDDRLYNEDTVKILLEESKKYNDKKVLSYYTDICNSKGEPWGENQKDETNYYWINHSCAIYPPHTFPQEAFYYFSMLLINEKMISDECFIMPLLIHAKQYPMYIHSSGRKGLMQLNKISPMIPDTQGNTALHKQFINLSKSNKTEDNLKNKFIQKVLSVLPTSYLIDYKQCFKNFCINTGNSLIEYIVEGSTLQKEYSDKERYIISCTSWKKRIENLHIVLKSLLSGEVLPDLIILNLAIEEFKTKENELPKELLELINKSSIIKINWLSHNTKVWKKIIPTLLAYPNDCIISVDDDFIYPADFLKTFKEVHTVFPNNPLSGNLAFLPGNCKAHCGCATLTKLEYYKDMLYSLTEDMYNAKADDLFYSYAAFCAKSFYMYVGKLYFTNMLTVSDSESYTLNIGIAPVKIWNDVYIKLLPTIKKSEVPGNDFVTKNYKNIAKELEYTDNDRKLAARKTKKTISIVKVIPKQEKENTTIKIINKPIEIKSLDTYKLPVKSIRRKFM